MHLCGLIVQQVAVEQFGGHGVVEYHPFGHVAEIPVGISFVEEPNLQVGVASGIFHRQSAIEVKACHLIHTVGASGLLESEQGISQSGRKHFVGIDGQHVAVAGERGGILALGAIPGDTALLFRRQFL